MSKGKLGAVALPAAKSRAAGASTVKPRCMAASAVGEGLDNKPAGEAGASAALYAAGGVIPQSSAPGAEKAVALPGAMSRPARRLAVTSRRAGVRSDGRASDKKTAGGAAASPASGVAKDAVREDSAQAAAGGSAVAIAGVADASGTDIDIKPARSAAHSATPARRRARQREAVPWSEEREAIFLETLGMTCSVANATRASGLSSASIYRRRAASDTFRAGWAAAVREGYVRLETEMLHRAIHGVRKTRWYAGKKVGSVREYADRGALSLLGQYRALGQGAAPPSSSQADARIVLIEVLARMNRGMGGDG